MKFCVKCKDPIHTTELPDDVDERCVCCADAPQDAIECIKQEAYADGWADALDNYGGNP